MTEAKFKAKLSKTLRDAKTLVFSIENTVGRGIPDLAMLAAGGTVWIEVKASKGPCYLRKEQYVWQFKATREQFVPVLTVHLSGDKVRFMGLKDPRPVKDKFGLTQILWEGTYEEFAAAPLETVGQALQVAHSDL